MSKNFHTRVPRLILPTLVAAALVLLAAFAAAQPASTPGGDNASRVVPAEQVNSVRRYIRSQDQRLEKYER